MADYSIIADASATLLRLLRAELCPEPVVSPESISLSAPNDKNADFQLGVYLYDIKELSEYRSSVPLYPSHSTRTAPPKPLSLYYMLYINSKAQVAAGAEMEQRIFGRAMQALMDNPVLSMRDTNPYLPEDEDDAAISILTLSFEDKTKIWTSLSAPYQVAVYINIAPLMLTPRSMTSVPRVQRVQAGVEITEEVPREVQR
jgi:hypothetical protein